MVPLSIPVGPRSAKVSLAKFETSANLVINGQLGAGAHQTCRRLFGASCPSPKGKNLQVPLFLSEHRLDINWRQYAPGVEYAPDCWQ